MTVVRIRTLVSRVAARLQRAFDQPVHGRLLTSTQVPEAVAGRCSQEQPLSRTIQEARPAAGEGTIDHERISQTAPATREDSMTDQGTCPSCGSPLPSERAHRIRTFQKAGRDRWLTGGGLATGATVIFMMWLAGTADF